MCSSVEFGGKSTLSKFERKTSQSLSRFLSRFPITLSKVERCYLKKRPRHFPTSFS